MIIEGKSDLEFSKLKDKEIVEIIKKIDDPRLETKFIDEFSKNYQQKPNISTKPKIEQGILCCDRLKE